MSFNHRSPLIPFHRERFSNGVTLLVKESRAAPLAAVDLWVGAGTAREGEGEGGISHFLEHLYFKGTPTRPVGAMDREIKSLGGYNNAATSYDFTHYYVVLPAEHGTLAMDILVDALLNMTLPEEEIERERRVILEEIARKDDSPMGKLYDEFLARAFARTPYQMPILGTAESLAGIDRDRLLDYRERFYTPGYLHVSVCGDVDRNHILDRTHDLLGDLKTGGAPNPAGADTETALKEPRFEIAKDVTQTYLCLGTPTPKIQGTEDEIALDLLSTVLGEGRSSRLVSKLVEETGLCSNVSAYVWSLEGVGLFGVEACYEQKDEEEVLSIIEEEWRRIRDQNAPQEEMDKAKIMSMTQHAYSLERVSSMAGVLGKSSASDQIDQVLAYSNRIEAMTPERARERLNQCCDDGDRITGFVRPEGGK